MCPPVRLHPTEESNQRVPAQGPMDMDQASLPQGHTALEDALGGWLNGHHQAELRAHEESLEIAERIAASTQGALNDAIRYYNQWSSLDDGVSRVQHQIEELLGLGHIDNRARHILMSLQESLYVTRRVAMNMDIIDLTTDEELEDEQEHAMVIDLTQD